MRLWTTLTIAASLVLAQAQFQDPSIVQPGCEFPPSWEGGWFLINERDPLMVTKEDLGILGMCFEKVEGEQENQYIIYERNRECYRCINLFERHENVLQFQMGGCEPPSQVLSEPEVDPEKLCQMIPVEEPASTLVRLSGEDAPCPFDGEYSFTFTEGQQNCHKSRSQLTSCMTPNQVALRFQPCQMGGQGQIETLTCKGHWSEDGNTHFLIGILDIPYVTKLSERIRCFIYRSGNGGGTIQMGQSADASCRSLQQIKDGARTLNMKRVSQSSGGNPQSRGECLFPSWVIEMGPFHTFSFTSLYEFTDDGTTIIISNYSYISQESHQLAKTACVELIQSQPEVIHSREEPSTLFDDQDSSGRVDYVKMVTKVTAGCETNFKCLSIHKRTEHILEIQEGQLARTQREACTYHNMNEDLLPFTMLIRAKMEDQPCTADGWHNVTNLDLKGQTDPCGNKAGFQEVQIKCGDSENEIEFIRSCDGQEMISLFHCLGGWEEEIPYNSLPISSVQSTSNVFNPFPRSRDFKPYKGFNSLLTDYEFEEELPENVTLGYMIARPNVEDSNSPRRVCFIYTYFNDTYYWTVDTNTCLRKIRPGEVGKFRFNTTKLESCDALSIMLQNASKGLLALCLSFSFLPSGKLWTASFLSPKVV